MNTHSSSLTPLTAAGSNRRYYRQTESDGSTRIYVEGTSRTENHAFLTLARHFEKLGLPTPRVLSVSNDEMSYWQEDLGSLSLFEYIRNGRETGEYNTDEQAILERTIRQLAHIQIIGAQALDWSVCYPVEAMDRRSIFWDLNYFKYCYLKGTGIEIDECRLEDDFESLTQYLLSEQMDVFMYRDCQSRNVMLVERKGELHPYFIDFQGGRRGAKAYDVASFLWQAKANMPQTLREQLIRCYLDEVSSIYCSLGKEFDPSLFLQRLPYWVLFRTLQVMGAYGFRGFVERKAHFMESLPLAEKNLRELFLSYPELVQAFPYLYQVAQSIAPSPKPVTCVDAKELVVTVISFSYKRGIPADDSGNGGGYVFDCRSTHNPGKYDEYKQLTGLDQPVIDFLEKDGEILRFLEHTDALVSHHVERYLERGFSHLQIAFGCTGGQHRSVYSAEQTARLLSQRYPVRVHLIHREQQIDRYV